jgi:hypothetical protein
MPQSDHIKRLPLHGKILPMILVATTKGKEKLINNRQKEEDCLPKKYTLTLKSVTKM